MVDDLGGAFDLSFIALICYSCVLFWFWIRFAGDVNPFILGLLLLCTWCLTGYCVVFVLRVLLVVFEIIGCGV